MDFNPGDTIEINFYVENTTPGRPTDLAVGCSLLTTGGALMADGEWCQVYGEYAQGDARPGKLYLTIPETIPLQQDYVVSLKAWLNFNLGTEITERVVGSGAERTVWFVYAPSTGALVDELDSDTQTIFVEEGLPPAPQISARIVQFTISKA